MNIAVAAAGGRPQFIATMVLTAIGSMILAAAILAIVGMHYGV